MAPELLRRTNKLPRLSYARSNGAHSAADRAALRSGRLSAFEPCLLLLRSNRCSAYSAMMDESVQRKFELTRTAESY